MKNQKFYFVQSDLMAIYCNGENTNKNIWHNNGRYYIYVLRKGKAKIEYSDKIFYLKPNDTFFANKNEKFKISLTGKHIEFIEISFKAKFFHEIDPKIDILKPFSYSEKDKIKVYGEDTQDELYNFAVKSVIRSLTSQSSRGIVLSAVLQLICEIYYIYNRLNPPPLIESDSNFAKLYRYIDDHIYEKLTLKSTAEGTFLSARNITYILRKISGMSFHEFITDRRLEHAKSLIDEGNYKLAEIATDSGFDSYTTFYRLFKDKFNVSPSEYKKMQKTP